MYKLCKLCKLITKPLSNMCLHGQFCQKCVNIEYRNGSEESVPRCPYYRFSNNWQETNTGWISLIKWGSAISVCSDCRGRKTSFQMHAHGRCLSGGTRHLLSRSIGLGWHTQERRENKTDKWIITSFSHSFNSFHTHTHTFYIIYYININCSLALDAAFILAANLAQRTLPQQQPIPLKLQLGSVLSHKNGSACECFYMTFANRAEAVVFCWINETRASWSFL